MSRSALMTVVLGWLLLQVGSVPAPPRIVSPSAVLADTTTTTSATSSEAPTTATATAEVPLRRPPPPSTTDADPPPSSHDAARPEARGPPSIRVETAGSIAPGGRAARAADDLLVDEYAALARRKDISGQAHHLNQDAAFKSVIPSRRGVSMKLKGDALTQPGTPHFEAHASLERFWAQFRRGGARAGQVPTNLEYSKALLDSLEAAGLSRAQALQAVRASIRQRINVGQLGGVEVPRVPRKIYQSPRP